MSVKVELEDAEEKEKETESGGATRNLRVCVWVLTAISGAVFLVAARDVCREFRAIRQLPDCDQLLSELTEVSSRGPVSTQYRPGRPFIAVQAGSRVRAVRTVCVAGFELAQSTFYLGKFREAAVHSFDAGGSGISRETVERLRSRFPDRFHAHVGNLSVTLPRYIRDNPDFRCDVTYVDGGIGDVEAALRNLATVSTGERSSSVVYDIYRPTAGEVRDSGSGRLWYYMTRTVTVRNTYRCVYRVRPLLARLW